MGALAFVDEPQLISFAPGADGFALLSSGDFAVALIYVSYAYTGWNAATYLSSELENPQRTLPLILISGTLIVMALYIALNFVFLYTTPMDAMEGQLEVGFIAAEAAFGSKGGQFMGLISVSYTHLRAHET